MKEFWAIHVDGFLDMRSASGPWRNEKRAIAEARKLADYERNGLRSYSCQVGDWFAIHRDRPDDGSAMTMVDGPYTSKSRATLERLANIRDSQSFEIDCNGHKGFVAQIVALVKPYRAVAVRS